jgi:AcrR family transcriptional regulator
MRCGVKSQRHYDSSRRRAQAARTRDDVVDAAGRLFLANGYGRTTVSAIADAAGVSVETVYKGFGGKAGLVRSLVGKGLEGVGPVPAEQRSDAMQATEPDPRAIIRNWTRLGTEVAPRVAPIVLLIRSAADTDPQMAALLAEVDEQRLQRMESNARTLRDRGALREGVTLERARDVLWSVSSPELYELLVRRRGWSIDRFAEFQADLMIAALLPSALPDGGGVSTTPPTASP